MQLGLTSVSRMTTWRKYCAERQLRVAHDLQNCWNLYWLAVDPTQQRKGIGSWLLQKGLARVRQLDKNATIYACTASPEAALFFKNKGFKIEEQGGEGGIYDPPCLYSVVLKPL